MKTDTYICLCGSWATAHNALATIIPLLPPGSSAIVNQSRRPHQFVLEVEVPGGFDITSVSAMAFQKIKSEE